DQGPEVLDFVNWHQLIGPGRYRGHDPARNSGGCAPVTWLLLSFGIALSSALLPLVSVEVFVITMASSQPTLHWAAIAAVVAVGQVLGKVPYFLAARGSIHLPAFM